MTECDSCKFWEQQTVIVGLCRRHAPIHVVVDGQAIWPETNHDDWCGDAAEKDKDDEQSNA